MYQQLVDEFEIGVNREGLLQDYISEFKYSCVPFPNLLNMLEDLRKSNLILVANRIFQDSCRINQ